MLLTRAIRRRARGMGTFVLTLLAIEVLDEFVFGTREAAWPLIRDDLGLSYAQIGLLMGVPNIIANFIEPALGILGDVWNRRVLILGGGLFFALTLLLTGLSQSVGVMMLAFIVLYPASGAFVGLAQATLMDIDPTRHEQNMARWTLAGSLGVVGGALVLGVSVAIGLGWRGQFIVLAAVTLGLLIWARRFAFPNNGQHDPEAEPIGFMDGLKNAGKALRRREVLRWLTLLQFSDLMMDILLSYLALYFVDVVGASEAEAAVAVAVWTVVGLVGDVLLIPLLERVHGLSYLRVSAALEFLLFAAFLLVPNVILKLVILAALGFFNSGWYSILAGQLYSAMPGQSGTVMTVGNIFGLVGSFIPLLVGLLAEWFGLNAAMWFLLLGPVVLLAGIPRGRGRHNGTTPSPQS